MALMALPQYDAIRNRLQGQFSQQRSEQDDALKRRFAMTGMLGSGAYQKSAQMQDDELGKRQAGAMVDVDFQEAGEQQRQKEVGEGRQFQTGEREGAQRFAAEEAAKGRVFQTGERMGGQEFMRGERLGGQEWQQGNMNRQFDMQDREYQQSLWNNWLNTIAAMKEADFSGHDLSATLMELERMGFRPPQQGGSNPFARRMG